MNFGIIAAGEGSRLVQEGVAVPKPLVEIDGRPMIGRLIDIFLHCHASSISIIINETMTEVKEWLDTLLLPEECPLQVIIKSTPSSMHSFYELAKNLHSKGKFIITTVDTIFRENDFKKYVEAFHESKDLDGMMAVTDFIDDEKPLYVSTNVEDYITGYHDKAPEVVQYISAGIYGLVGTSFPILEKCIAEGVTRMRNYQRALIEAGLRLKAFDLHKVLDVDHASDIEKAIKFLTQDR